MDDEQSILDLVSESLGTRGFDVACAASSEAAVALAARNSYEVILCDLNLQSESGRTVSGFDLHDRVCEILAERSSSQPLFIFMTGDLLDVAITEQVGCKGNHFLQKPFHMAELVSLLNGLLFPDRVLQPKNSLS